MDCILFEFNGLVYIWTESGIWECTAGRLRAGGFVRDARRAAGLQRPGFWWVAVKRVPRDAREVAVYDEEDGAGLIDVPAPWCRGYLGVHAPAADLAARLQTTAFLPLAEAIA